MDRLNALKRQYRGVAHEDEMADRYPLCTFGNNPRAASIDTPLHGFLPVQARRSPPSRLGHRARRLRQRPRAAEAAPGGDGHQADLAALEAARLRAGPLAGEGRTREPGRGRHSARLPRPVHLGRYRPRELLNTLRVLDGIGQYRAEADRGEGRGALRRREVRGPARPGRAGACTDAGAPRRSRATAIGHFNAETRCCGSSTPSARSCWPSRERAAPITLCAPRSARSTSPGPGEWRQQIHCWRPPVRPRNLSRRLRALLRGEQGRPICPPSARKPDGRSRSRRRHVRLRPQQGGGANHRRVLRQRHPRHGGRDRSAIGHGQPRAGRMPGTRAAPACGQLRRPAANEAFNIEYWLLEEAKLRRMPPEKELSRKVAVVVGSGPSIGQAVAERLAKEGAHVVVADIRPELAEAGCCELQATHGKEIALAETVDCTDRESVSRSSTTMSSGVRRCRHHRSVAAVFFPPDRAARSPRSSGARPST